MKTVPPTEEGIQEAAGAIRAGDVVVYPTETVYGLAVDPFSETALERLFSAKGRDRGNPILLVVGETAHLERVCGPISAGAAACMKAFWPGPLSLVLPAAAGLPEALLGDNGKVCVRHTSCVAARALCMAFGGAITSTSANRSGESPARALGELVLGGVAVGIDGGRLEASAASTVFDPDEGRVLRQGAVSEEALRAVLGALDGGAR